MLTSFHENFDFLEIWCKNMFMRNSCKNDKFRGLAGYSYKSVKLLLFSQHAFIYSRYIFVGMPWILSGLNYSFIFQIPPWIWILIKEVGWSNFCLAHQQLWHSLSQTMSRRNGCRELDNCHKYATLLRGGQFKGCAKKTLYGCSFLLLIRY